MAITYQPPGWMHQVGLAVESEFGTWVAPTQWVPATSKIKKDPAHKPVWLAVGSYKRRFMTTRGIRVAGGLTYPLCPGRCDEFADMFEYVSGEEGRILKSHSILERHSAEFAKAHVGITVARARIVCAPEEDLIAELETIGKNTTTDKGVGTPNYDNQPAAFTGFDLTLTADTAEIEEWRRLEIEVDHRLRDDKFGADRMVRELPSRGRDVTVRIDMDWESVDWYDDFMAGTEIAIEAVWASGANNLRVTCPICVINEGADPEQQDRDGEDQVQPEMIALEGYAGADEIEIAVDE